MIFSISRSRLLTVMAVWMACQIGVFADDVRSVAPTVGLRSNPPSSVLLRGATLMTGPEDYSDRSEQAADDDAHPRGNEGDVLIQAGAIVAVGPSITPPPGCQIIDCSGKTLSAGWINAWQEAESDHTTPAELSDDYWNANIVVNRRIRELSAVPDAGKLRSQGFTTTVLAPRGRILGGRPSVWSLNELEDGGAGPQRLAETNWMTAALSVPRPNDAGERYPNSPMGAVALLRQSLYDARWYGEATTAYQADTALPKPALSATLAALRNAMESSTFVFDGANERMALRAEKVAREFSLRAIIRGSGMEYRDADTIAATGRALILPVNFPSDPNVITPEDAREVELVDLLHWKFASSNPAEMVKRGVSVCLSADRLEDVGKFRSHLHEAIQNGLSHRDAIAALTTTPARLLGIDATHGRIAVGMSADLILSDGDLFAKDTDVLKVFVAGQEFEITAKPGDELASIVGSWQLKIPHSQQHTVKLVVTQKEGRVSADLIAQADSDKPVTIELKKIVQRSDQFAAQIDCGDGTSLIPTALQLPAGTHRVVVSAPGKSLGSVSPTNPFVVQFYPTSATARRFKTKWIDPAEETAKADGAEVEDSEDKDSQDKESKDKDSDQSNTETESAPEESDVENAADADAAEKSGEETESIEIVFPLGAYGRERPVPRPHRVLFRGAIVWTCEDRDDLKVPETPQDVLIEDGKIIAIEDHIQLKKGDDCVIIDATGKHLTPGLIDCHSHAATDGGINESGQAITSEVRIADFIDPTDITVYRQLAGGVTTANVLHGSANPIGGQNQVVKFRWGDSMDDFVFTGAPAGIKFALGENVKRSPSRYPNTRMGVEQLLRDQMLAAREYAVAHRRWQAGERGTLPPRVDLQLQAIAEIQAGKRWIHCHSYRQDEIVATLDVLDEFGIKIGSLQHILEGYKVADAMVKHGAMASSFADWWAYKFEVYDAIPYNGVLMHRAGVVVSYNSDDPELGRHLNTEAAKAVKYGGVRPTEALKFVTLNPAKQLRIEDRVGSIEVGKDADLVLWSGPPLSTTTRCEQTWIDGRPIFDLDSNARLRKRDQTWRNQLIQELLDGKPKQASSEKTADAPESVAEADRWLRYDEFCNSRGAQQSSIDQRNGDSK
ncbi:amidohydrolase family protein [Allorhodopirellula heiligendammensis]|nr:amidohydrolase family protein [Allorhodopirellula heiligendammensis]